jgi:phytoene synthase
VALQLTNILRDVGEDWGKGRLYLPQEDLERFGLDETDIAAARLDRRWQALMRFQIERTRSLYAEAMPGIAYLSADGRFAVMAAAVLYRDILQDIERHNYDAFTRRAYVSSLGKLARLPSIWWQSLRAAA